MSQVMESPVNGSVSNGRSPETVFTGPEQQQGFDIIKVLWRWKWLPILGAMIGTGVGYLYFSKQPAQYQASALVQVVDSLPPSTRIQAYDPNEIAKYSRADESMVIRSQRVLKMAVEKGQLADQPALKGSSPDQIAAMLAGPNLVVQPAAKDANTTLLQISYICNDADLAAAVVNAIVHGYSDYLSEEYRVFGDEFYELVTQAQDKLTLRYKELNDKNMEFRKNAPNVVWTGDEFSDPYAEAYKSLNSDIRALQSKREVILATLQQIKNARDAGRPAEAILLMLTDQNLESLFASVRSESNPVPPRFETTVTESAQLQKTELFPLQMRERELVGKVGENHPSLSTIRERIQIMQEHIARLAQSERLELARREQLMKEAEEEAKKNGGATQGISMEQRVAIREQALGEQMASIELQLKGLSELARNNLEKSKEHQTVLSSNTYLNSELQSIKQMLDQTTEKFNAINLLPKVGHRTLKELNLPSIGYFYGPKLTPYLLGGAAIGFLVLSGLAVLMDLADRSYRNPDEIASDLNMPVLGHIPVMEITKVKKVYEAADSSLTTLHHSRGRASEAYRAVRTGLFF